MEPAFIESLEVGTALVRPIFFGFAAWSGEELGDSTGAGCDLGSILKDICKPINLY